MKILLVVFIVLAGAGVMFSLLYAMGRQPRYHPGGPYYYRSWASYAKPYRPTGEIPEAEAQALGKKGVSYYVAYFDDQGKIRSFTKYLHGQVVWEERYEGPPGKRTPSAFEEFLLAQARKNGLITLPSLPKGKDLREVVINPALVGYGYAQLDEEGLRKLFDTAIPIVDTDPTIVAWSYALWCSAFFKAEAAQYGADLYLGGRGRLQLPNGKYGYFKFDVAETSSTVLTCEEAIVIARQATNQMNIPKAAPVSCEQDGNLYVVTFKMLNPPTMRGPDYYAQVHIDGLSRKVIKLLVSP